MKIFHALAICLLLLFSLPAAPRAENQPSTEAQKTSQALSPLEQAEHLLKAISLIKEIMPAPKESLTDVDAKTFWPSAGVLVAAIFTLFGTMYTNRITLKKTKLEFEHQESVTSREQCKEYCVEFLSKLDILTLQDGIYDLQRIRYLVTAITIFSPANYSRYIVRLATFLHSNLILVGSEDRFPANSAEKSQYDEKRNEFATMYTFMVIHTKVMFAGEDLEKNLDESQELFIKRKIDPHFLRRS